MDGLNNLIRAGGDRCLFNVPTNLVDNPRCGNEIVEGNEACDCGSPERCRDSCCNAATCQLATGAECASGACCTSQCRLRDYGIQCRAASGSCDIPEYCLGDSSECPEDNHRVDGMACTSNSIAGYCSGGVCPTHDAQCRATFSK